jgi:hypothetical protein
MPQRLANYNGLAVAPISAGKVRNPNAQNIEGHGQPVHATSFVACHEEPVVDEDRARQDVSCRRTRRELQPNSAWNSVIGHGLCAPKEVIAGSLGIVVYAGRGCKIRGLRPIPGHVFRFPMIGIFHKWFSSAAQQPY